MQIRPFALSEPDWHRIAVWGFRFETSARLLKKESLVGMEERLRIRGYVEDGMHTSVHIIADEVLYLDRYERKEAQVTDAVFPAYSTTIPVFFDSRLGRSAR